MRGRSNTSRARRRAADGPHSQDTCVAAGTVYWRVGGQRLLLLLLLPPPQGCSAERRASRQQNKHGRGSLCSAMRCSCHRTPRRDHHITAQLLKHQHCSTFQISGHDASSRGGAGWATHTFSPAIRPLGKAMYITRVSPSRAPLSSSHQHTQVTTNQPIQPAVLPSPLVVM